MKMPRSGKEAEELLRAVVPGGKDVTLRPMFGNLSVFVKGNMFAGVFGDDLFVRLSDDDRGRLLSVHGASVFEPMKGRQMRDYVVVPKEWTKDQSKIRPWVASALEWSSKLPAKQKKR